MTITSSANIIRRTRYLIAKKFQLKYVGVILLFMFLTSILCSYAIYQASLTSFGENLMRSYPDDRLTPIIRSANLRILLSFLILAPFVAVIGIYLSHRIAGPIFNIERFITKLAYGDFSRYIILRKKDELMPLADRINGLVKNMKYDLMEQKRRLEKISSGLDALKRTPENASGDVAEILHGINHVDQDVKALIKEYNRYKF